MARNKKIKTQSIIPVMGEGKVLEGTLEALALFGSAIELDRNNVGGMYDQKTGQYTRFGKAGELDIEGYIRRGPNEGKVLAIETKRGGFNPTKVTGEEKERFEIQRHRMHDINMSKGIAFWVRDPAEVVPAIQKILAGARVEIDENGWPWLIDGEM
jgi:hypothetical protein